MSDPHITDPADAVALVAGDEQVPPTAEEAPKKYTVRGLVEIARLKLPPAEAIWNGMERNPGAVVEVIGSPGIGKSRFVGDLAKHQILGREYLGLQTLRKPLKWLFVGSENGIRRLQKEARLFLYGRSDVDGMSADELLALAAGRGLSADDVKRIDANFRTFTLEDPADCYISLGDEVNVAKLTATLADEKPDVPVFDPWGDVIAGEELKDADVRETVRIIRKAERDAGLVNALSIIINHARIGAKEEANARGMEAGNFGKNSKCLYSIARYVLNIRRASFADNPPIEIICAKNNDGVKPPSVAAELDPATMTYHTFDDFDADAWQATLEEKAGISHATRTSVSSDAIQKAALEICAATADDPLTATEFKNAIMSKVGGRKTAVENWLASALRLDKSLAKTPKRKPKSGGSYVRDGKKEVVSTPDVVRAYAAKYPLSGEEVLL